MGVWEIVSWRYIKASHVVQGGNEEPGILPARRMPQGLGRVVTRVESLSNFSPETMQEELLEVAEPLVRYERLILRASFGFLTLSSSYAF